MEDEENSYSYCIYLTATSLSLLNHHRRHPIPSSYINTPMALIFSDQHHRSSPRTRKKKQEKKPTAIVKKKIENPGTMFICGTGNFSQVDGDIKEPGSLVATPGHKRSKRSASFCRILGCGSGGKNPYADRGLDKFYALLADLDGRKQKIYTEMGSEGISFVRFVYANDESNRVKPIVVRVKDRRPEKKGNFVKQVVGTENRANGGDKIAVGEKEEISREKRDEKKKRFLRCKESFRLETLRQPYWYFMAIVVLIMVLLAVFGRSFTILCTSIGWYAMPSVVGGSPPSPPPAANERKPKRKKEYVRKQSEKIHAPHISGGPSSSPRSVIHGPSDNK